MTIDEDKLLGRSRDETCGRSKAHLGLEGCHKGGGGLPISPHRAPIHHTSTQALVLGEAVLLNQVSCLGGNLRAWHSQEVQRDGLRQHMII